MTGEILRLKPEEVRKLIKQGKIKLAGDPADPTPVEAKPDETTTTVSPINTSAGVSATGIGRRRLLWVAGAAIVGVGGFLIVKNEEYNRQEVTRQNSARAERARLETFRAESARLEAVRAEVARQEVTRKAEIERVAKLFGEDFLGEQAIHKLEDKFRASRIGDVKFEIPIIPFHLNQTQLETAKKDEQKGKARMVVLRPEFMTVRGERQLITFASLYNIYGVRNNTNNPFVGSGLWFDSAPFAKEGLKAKFALPTKEVIPGSLGKKWNEQEKLIEPGESRREVVEVLWDILLYYGTTDKRLLGSHLDWTKTHTGNGDFGCLGRFNSGGYEVTNRNPSDNGTYVGVCTTL